MLRTWSLPSQCGVQPCRQALRQQLTHVLQPGRLQRTRAVPDQQQARTVIMPGALWLLSEEGWSSIPVHGEGFIMQRSSASSAEGTKPAAGGLVPYIRHPMGMAVRPVEPTSLGAMAAALPLVTVPILPNETCTGIVPWVDPDLEDAGLLPDVQLAGPAQLHGLAMSSALAGRQESRLLPLVGTMHVKYSRHTERAAARCNWNSSSWSQALDRCICMVSCSCCRVSTLVFSRHTRTLRAAPRR